MIYKFVSLVLLVLAFSGLNAKQPRDGAVKVHLVCHSHCDAGWLSTFEGYYSQNVQSILDSTIQELEKNDKRKFIWSEIGYLDRWWKVASQDKKDLFTRLVQKKQIELVNGGWVQNDEACPTVDGVIRHLADGHKFIIEHFGEEYLPTSGWQIDPFGHSSLTATIQAQMGYKHVVLDRIHYTAKNRLKEEQNIDFMWRGSPNVLGPKSDILAHVLDDFYIAPFPFHFEFPMGYGHDFFAQKMIELGENRKGFFKAPHILLPLGGDFNYRHANYWYDYIDPLVHNVNEAYNKGTANVSVDYSTLSDYFSELTEWYQLHNETFNYYDGDFFPYADNENAYWTGYFTSKPWLKGLVRMVASKLRSAEVFNAYQNLENLAPEIQDASYNCSIMQHHDAITGTALKHVVDDYISRMKYAENQLNDVFTRVITNIAKDALQINDLKTSAIAEYPPTEMSIDNATPVIITNSLNWKRNEVHSIRINYRQSPGSKMMVCPFSVYEDNLSKPIKADCSWRNETRIEAAGNVYQYVQIDFPVDIPALGMRTYYIGKNDPSKKSKMNLVDYYNKIPYNTVSNHDFTFHFSPETGFLKSITEKSRDMTAQINHGIYNYKDGGGAYILTTQGQAFPHDLNGAKVDYWRGVFSHEIRVTTSTMVMIMRISDLENNKDLNKLVRFEYIVKGIDNAQIISRFSTSLKTNGFYSDNGLELVKRKLALSKETAHKYYYPSISISMIEDEEDLIGFSCVSDRSKGAAAIESGSMEFAIHRSNSQDDGKGLTTPAIDNTFINAKSHCWMGMSHEVMRSSRRESLYLDHPLRSFQITNSNTTGLTFTFSGLNKEMPKNVHILSMEQDESNTFKIRLLNIDETSQPTPVDIKSLFHFRALGNSLEITEEYNLNNQTPYTSNDISNIKFSNSTILNGLAGFKEHKEEFISSYPHRYTPILSSTIVTLYPLEIKSFSIKITN